MKLWTFLLATLSLAQMPLLAQPLCLNPAFSDANWVGFPGVPGFDGAVSALAFDAKGNLYVCGQFTTAGGVGAANIAKWDGRVWSALDAELTGGQYPSISALALDASGNLYVGGGFDSVGGVSATNIAKWDGKAWSALSSGVWGGYTLAVSALALDASGNLYVGGSFTNAGGLRANNIAKWSGGSWSALGSGVGDQVNALVFDTNGNLYAGGYFDTAGGVGATNIAKWNGSSWSALGTGVGSQYPAGVYALTLDARGNLYAGGDFNNAGAVLANYVAKWDGKTWSSLGLGTGDAVSSLGFDTNGTLYAGGYFTSAGGVPANYIAKWDGTNWFPLSTGTDDAVLTLTLDGKGHLYAGGRFGKAGGVLADYLAKWDGSTWSAPGEGTDSVDGSILALTFDGAGNLYAGGHFTRLGGVGVTNVAKWNGITWSALGAGIGDINGVVSALTFDGKGALYAGGHFNSAGGLSITNVAKWNGVTWSALGGGVGDGNSGVSALAFDSGANLYAGGGFTNAGGINANFIAKWDGSVWSALGAGMGSVYPGAGINALAFDAKGNLYAGGAFTSAGGVLATNIATWNGAKWSALGTGLSSLAPWWERVNALAFDPQGNLYGALNFHGIDTGAFYISKWDGSGWSDLPDVPWVGRPIFPYRFVGALAVCPFGALYAGVRFSRIGEIARWDGSTWSFLGSGLSGSSPDVAALAFDTKENLYVSGGFLMAGTNASAYIAKAVLTGPTPNQVLLANTSAGTNIVTYLGTPGAEYALDLASSLTPPVNWIAQTTNAASTANATTAGYVSFTNSNPQPQAFYRTRLVP
jgi:hypothetical protein